jgi:hypothetical protein
VLGDRLHSLLLVAETLARHDPDALEQLGFFARDRKLLATLIGTLERLAADDHLRPLSVSVLNRIEALMPNLAPRAHSAIRLAEHMGRGRWWVPEDLSAPPSGEPVTAGPRDFRREDVDRVFSDL